MRSVFQLLLFSVVIALAMIQATIAQEVEAASADSDVKQAAAAANEEINNLQATIPPNVPLPTATVVVTDTITTTVASFTQTFTSTIPGKPTGTEKPTHTPVSGASQTPGRAYMALFVSIGIAVFHEALFNQFSS
ncbi:uncharacterized protein BYT42DRAFT_556155 [Radiomyces spectabilis]|uniref:uncharacterized protein n=1 Tax=Radiomyces spectabilis TaxID=64574 RepID=UPI00221F46FD|nr:uncharacterized protein BYT42DRAFT_556155 [Radiomyces spectabilis]KAI8391241.1 hypothetical protein BYT42DRAFT_556155 [Radiomyces spectabilis]